MTNLLSTTTGQVWIDLRKYLASGVDSSVRLLTLQQNSKTNVRFASPSCVTLTSLTVVDIAFAIHAFNQSYLIGRLAPCVKRGLLTSCLIKDCNEILVREMCIVRRETLGVTGSVYCLRLITILISILTQLAD